jgi:hypothetical protein
MRIPKYWARATAEAPKPDGIPVSQSCWRWSDDSEADARDSALAAATRIVRALIDGTPLAHYGYGNAPLREQLIQEVSDDVGQRLAAVTQNAYGALVLVTDQVMFVDVDFPPVQAGAELRYFFKRLVSKRAVSPEAEHENAARLKIERLLRERPDWGLRVYRTFAGLRVLVTHQQFDPAGDQTAEVFESLGADPLYQRLCKSQRSFRARLTPKPWRCGHTANHISWPRETADQQQRFEEWSREYSARQVGYATCRLLAVMGDGRVHPAVQPIVELHDHMTRCEEPLKLA